MLRFLVVTLLFFASMTASARSSTEDMLDEKLMLRSLGQIAEMNKAELSALNEVLSACGQLLPLDTGMPRYYCNKELIKYRTAGNRGPVTILLDAVFASSRRLLLPGSEKAPSFEALIAAHAELYDSLIQVAGMRALELTKLPPRSAASHIK